MPGELESYAGGAGQGLSAEESAAISAAAPEAPRRTPFEEDCAVLQLTAMFGFELLRQAAVEITDPKVIRENGLMHETPDYYRIRRLLEAGEIVQGARLNGTQYILRPKRAGLEEL